MIWTRRHGALLYFALIMNIGAALISIFVGPLFPWIIVNLICVGLMTYYIIGYHEKRKAELDRRNTTWKFPYDL